MLNFSKSQIALIFGVAFLTIFFCLPNVLPAAFVKKSPSWWQPMVLGLDLRGGTRMILEIDSAAILKEQVTNLEETIRVGLRDAKPVIRNRGVRATPDGVVIVTLVDAADMTAARTEVGKLAAGMTIENVGEDRLRVTIPEKVKRDQQIAAIAQSQAIVSRRIDEFGTSEANVIPQGSERLLVELPGVGAESSGRIKALIGQTAKMNFHLVEPNAYATDVRDLPPGTVLYPDSRNPARKYVVRRKVEVSGDHLIDAQPGFKEGGAIVNFRFDTSGGKRFGAVTAANVGNSLAIVLDEKVISAPKINGPIPGSGIIEGIGTTEDARDLAVLMRAGALPAPLIVIEERTIGPGLGADSIKAGTAAALLGGALVVIFMVVAYHTFGMFAVVGQVFHMGTLFATLSLFHGALTLPGIAGVVLSLGMAVDANVLIYERMREELHSGKGTLNSITSGFSHAYTTIIDSNLTNLIASLLMFMLGAGPVRGFALTLFIGILTSMFSAVMVTRFQVWLWYRGGKRKELPI